MPDHGGSRATMAHIAEQAGVSVPTVSKVLNGRQDVAPATRERVERLLAEHQYLRRPRRLPDRSGLVDLVFNQLDSPWAVEILRGVEDVAQAAGVGVIVSTIHGRAASTWHWLRAATRRRSDGVILVVSDVTPQQRSQLDLLGVPFVVVDPAGRPPAGVPSIGATNWAGGLAATEHLVALGHRRVGIISGTRTLLCSRARLDGYRAVLESADIPVDEGLIRHGDFHHESGHAQMQALLELPEPPTAVFAGSDQQAFGAIEALREHGLRVPDDVSVVGFDDLPVARWFSPPLTTVRQPLLQMGTTAAEVLLQLIDGHQPATHRVELATELIVRESTAPPPS